MEVYPFVLTKQKSLLHAEIKLLDDNKQFTYRLMFT